MALIGGPGGSGDRPARPSRPIDIDTAADEDYDPLFAALAAGFDPVDLLDQLATYRPAWHAHAACLGKGPDLFFIERGADPRPARALCDTCPTHDECYQAGETQRHGIWGGVSAGARRKARPRTIEAA